MNWDEKDWNEIQTKLFIYAKCLTNDIGAACDLLQETLNLSTEHLDKIKSHDEFISIAKITMSDIFINKLRARGKSNNPSLDEFNYYDDDNDYYINEGGAQYGNHFPTPQNKDKNLHINISVDIK